MAKTVFGIPGADTSQAKPGSAVAPKGVQSVHSGDAIPQKGGSVAIPGASRGLPSRPSRPPAGKPMSLPPTAPPAPPAPMTSTPPRPPDAPPSQGAASEGEGADVDVQGRTMFGMPAVKLPLQEEASQPKPAQPGERDSLWPESERAAVPPTTSTYPAPPVAPPVDELSASMLEPELSSDDQPTTPVPLEAPTEEEEILETARMPAMEMIGGQPKTAPWVWALVAAAALALAVGTGWLVVQMLQGNGGLDVTQIERSAAQE